MIARGLAYLHGISIGILFVRNAFSFLVAVQGKGSTLDRFVQRKSTTLKETTNCLNFWRQRNFFLRTQLCPGAVPTNVNHFAVMKYSV